jgi:uroporphyrinogen decarboxylase
MTSRERVLKTFNFEKADRLPCDLVENLIWPELSEYFKDNHGLTDREEILNFLDVDFRWIAVKNPYHARQILDNKVDMDILKDNKIELTYGTFSDSVFKRPYRNATVEQIEAIKFPTADDIIFPDFEEARRRWPDHALVFMPYNLALFMSACDAFGIEEAMVKMVMEPEVFEALIKKMHEYNMDVLHAGLKKAKGYCDICWTWDDFATQEDLIISPELWRRFIKPYLAEEIALMREYGMYTLYTTHAATSDRCCRI